MTAIREQRTAQDLRTAKQKAADDIALHATEAGEWDGFQVETHCNAEAAKQIIEHRQNLDVSDSLAALTKHPFRWKDRVFRIGTCHYENGKALVEATPSEPDFIGEIKKRIEQNRFHVLPYVQGFGFVCLPEDYEKYKD